jgi:hypothetical protein
VGGGRGTRGGRAGVARKKQGSVSLDIAPTILDIDRETVGSDGM